MAKISISRDGNEIGEYTKTEIEHLSRSRYFKPTDLYWQEGEQDWKPLPELVGAATWEEKKKGPGKIGIIAIVAGVMLALGVITGMSLVHRPAPPATKVDAAASPAGDPSQAAVEGFKAKLANLSHAPADTVYSRISYEVRKPKDSPFPLTGIVKGEEDLVTVGATSVAFVMEFTLTAKSDGREWVFDRCQGTVIDANNPEAVPFDEDAGHINFCRTLVETLGLKHGS